MSSDVFVPLQGVSSWFKCSSIEVVNQRPSEVVGQTDHDLPQLYHQNNIMYMFHLYLGLLFYVSPVELSSL